MTKEQQDAWNEPSPFAKQAAEHWKDLRFKTVLDLGTGMGADAGLFAKKGFLVSALDIDSDAIEQAQKNPRITKKSNITANQKAIKNAWSYFYGVREAMKEYMNKREMIRVDAILKYDKRTRNAA